MIDIIRDTLYFFRKNFMAIAGVFLPIVLPIILLDNLCTFKIIPDEQAKTILHLFFFINLFAYSIYTGA
ncbi:MAG: hypothetical protein QNI92_02515, partial [Desulfobacterales bacterium]|nr:hypothetical protein [Desulfobacterales bacterium]